MSSASPRPTPGPTRRTVVAAAAGAAGLAAALTACGSGADSSNSATTGSGSSGSSGSAGSSGSTGSAGAQADGAAGSTSLAKTSDIPEGGGKIFKDHGVVVTQPTAGTFKAFSSKCTHQGCAVTTIADGAIICPCHKSHFSVEDGSVKQGPATQALPAEKITVSGDEIALA
jgi:nitrite reductase/ring-hydroxylating ferredoxin subunit